MFFFFKLRVILPLVLPVAEVKPARPDFIWSSDQAELPVGRGELAVTSGRKARC